MISEIKQIRKNELDTLIKQSEQDIRDIQENQLEALLKERSRLTSPDIVRNFTWFQRTFTKRKEYDNYIKEATDNKARIPIVEENIAFCENKIADAKQNIGNANRKIIRFQAANSLDELEIDSFREAVELLEKHDKPLVLEKGDNLYPQVPANFREISDFCFIYKTQELPSTPEFSSKYETGGSTQTEVIFGETFQSLSVDNWERTVHGTINCLNHDIQSKYAVLSPFANLDKTKLISAMPNNCFFDSSFPIPEGSYILIPESELELVSEELQNHPGLTIIGYSDDIGKSENALTLNRTLSMLMNNLGYVEQELIPSGWDNTKNFHDFQSIVEPTLDDECKIDLNDVVEDTKNFPFELNRFLPFRTTKYLTENSKIKKKHCFAKALEYLHENIDDFNVSEKKLKTKTIVEYDTEALKSDPKDKSTEKVDDVFKDFIEALRSKDIKTIDKYLSYVDKRYIPNKEGFRDELLKSTSRLKNDGPIRNALFSNLFGRFMHLELEQELEELEAEVEQSIPDIPKIPEIKENTPTKARINEFGEIIRESKTEEQEETKEEKAPELKDEIEEITDTPSNEIKDKEKEKIIENLQKIEEEIEDDFEIIIEPRSDDFER